MSSDSPTKPDDVTEEQTWFDRAADTAAQFVARPPFFLTCLAIVMVWLVTGPHFDFSHGWVDAFELVAAMVTFLVVALLENESWRAGKATQRKLNAIAAALAEMMEKSEVDPEHVHQLNAAVGLEKRESSSR
jgi:low affinity Fe/Cu permease